MGEKIEVSAAMTNTGSRRGTETVQLYVRDQVGDVTRPVRELKGFQRVALEPGETRSVKFTLSTDDLSFTNQQLQAGDRAGQVRRLDRPECDRRVARHVRSAVNLAAFARPGVAGDK